MFIAYNINQWLRYLSVLYYFSALLIHQVKQNLKTSFKSFLPSFPCLRVSVMIILVCWNQMTDQGPTVITGKTFFCFAKTPSFLCSLCQTERALPDPGARWRGHSHPPGAGLPCMASPGPGSRGGDSAPEDHLLRGGCCLAGHCQSRGQRDPKDQRTAPSRSRAVPEGKPLFTEGKILHLVVRY